MTFMELGVTVDNNEQKRILPSTNETECTIVCHHQQHNTTQQDHFFLFSPLCLLFNLFLCKSFTHSFLSTSLETTIKLLLLATHTPLHFSSFTRESRSVFCHFFFPEILCSYCSILLQCTLALMKRHCETIVNEH